MPIFAHWIVCEEGIIKFAKMDEENSTYAHVWIEAIAAARLVASLRHAPTHW